MADPAFYRPEGALCLRMDAAGVVDQSLAECLDMLRRTFDLKRIAGQRTFLPDVAEYYQQSDAAYRLFHSSDGGSVCDEPRRQL